MKCLGCGQELDAGAVFCGNCGQQVSAQAVATPVAAQQEGPGAVAVQAAVPPQPVVPVAAPVATTPTPVPQVTYQPMVAPVPEGGGKAIAALVLGIIGLVGWVIPIVGLIMGICAVVFGSLTIKSNKKGFALTGIILGSIIILLSLFMWGFNINESLKSGKYGQSSLVDVTNEEVAKGLFTIQ